MSRATSAVDRQTQDLAPGGRPAGEGEADTRAGLFVAGLGKAGEPHLVEDTLDSLAEFLADLQVGADPGDARVTWMPADLRGPRRVGEAEEPAGVLDLDPVGEDLHPDVVSHAVGAVD